MCTPHRARAPTRSLEAHTRAVVVLVSVLGAFVPVRTGAGGNSHEELRGDSPGMPSLPMLARAPDESGGYFRGYRGEFRARHKKRDRRRIGNGPAKN